MKISVLQLNSRDDKKANLETIKQLVQQAVAEDQPDLIVTPEYAPFLGGTKEEQWQAAEVFPNGEAYQALQALAKTFAVNLHVGSMLEKAGDKYYNTSVVFDHKGNQLATYRKIHLFDIQTPSGFVFKESDIICRGNEVVHYSLNNCKIGMSICYDLRFSELFLKHAQAECRLIIVPAAFNLETGKDHWEVLCRARAIETQCYLIASGQVGLHREAAGESACFGNSLAVDPWGAVIARASHKVGWFTVKIDLPYQDHVMTRLPIKSHRVL